MTYLDYIQQNRELRARVAQQAEQIAEFRFIAYSVDSMIAEVQLGLEEIEKDRQAQRARAEQAEAKLARIRDTVFEAVFTPVVEQTCDICDDASCPTPVKAGVAYSPEAEEFDESEYPEVA